MELSNQHYLGNDGANPFYHGLPEFLGNIDGVAIFEGNASWLLCMLEDAPSDDDDFIPF